ncbi:MAG: molybdenum cofactor biosynthesis protein MoaE [Bacillota bacterium]|nr:molybdenum cofactor biosynthesis protein MoaE [Bacillota bacterium]
MINKEINTERPSIDQWLREARADSDSEKVGMFLIHNGVVRQTPKEKVRKGIDDGTEVRGMDFSFDARKVEEAVEETRKRKGIFYVRVWLNEGYLETGDDIMVVLIGGDIRPHVVDALQYLVEKVKTECVTEVEHKG